MKKLLAVAILTAALSGVIAATAGARPAASQRVPLTCEANLNADTGLTAGFIAPDTPKLFDIVPPIGAYAGATGVGLFSADGRMSITCDRNGWSDGSPAWGASYSGHGACYLSRGGDEFGNGATLYTGTSTVTVTGSRVRITCVGAARH